MIKKGYLKQRLRLDTLSRQTFLSGLGMGLFSAVVFSLFFNYGRELMRYHFSMAFNLVEISPERYQAYGFFFAALSLSLGSNLMLWIWCRGVKASRPRLKNHLRLGSLYAFFILWMTLEVFVNFTFATSFGIYGHWGERTVPFITGIQSSVLYLLPLVIFLHGWHNLRLYFRSLRWMLLHLAVVVLLSFPLAWMTLPDKAVVEEIYAQFYQPENSYLEMRLNMAEQQYDLTFTQHEKRVLKQFSTISAQEQLKHIKNAFASRGPVNLKEIIVLKISIHNLRPKGRVYNFFTYWPYPKPEDMYRQLNYFPPESNEAKEITQAVEELARLYNVTFVWREEKKDMRQMRRYSFQRNLFRGKAIADSLKSVVRKINADTTLRKHYGLLPFPDNEKRRYYWY